MSRRFTMVTYRGISPGKLVLYSSLILFATLFFQGDPLSVAPAVLLVAAVEGLESHYRFDFRKKHNASTLQVSLFLAVLSVATSFYFGLHLWYAAAVALAAIGVKLINDFQFPSDILLSLVVPLLLIAHSTEYITLSPVYWFVFFYGLSVRSARELTKPFGVENFNLPKILGTEAAKDFVFVLRLLALIWPVLFARYAPDLSFFAFSAAAMLVAVSAYALLVSRLDESQTLMHASAVAYLTGLFLFLL